MTSSSGLRDLLDLQCGVVTRRQLVAHGVTVSALRAAVRGERWQAVRPTVYAVHTGPLSRDAQLWAALLVCGSGAALSHQTAAEVDGLDDARPEGLLHITVPADRRVSRKPGIRIHYSARIDRALHPTRQPPRLRIEHTVLGLTEVSHSGRDAMAWVLRACQRRLTTPDRLAATMLDWSKLRWRAVLEAALADARSGVHSVLEHRYASRVESAHGLPRGDRQPPGQVDLQRVWRDVRYRAFRTLVELDGRLGHEDDGRFRDMRRDNAASVEGYQTLRFGWLDVSDSGCEAAQQLAIVLRANGWSGAPRRCGPVCSVR